MIDDAELAAMYERSKDDREIIVGSEVRVLIGEVRRLTAERDKLQAFKMYVHSRLNAAGVPADPDSPHKAEGCRVGGRLDLVLARWRADDAEPADAEWAEKAGFRWHPDGECMVLPSGTWELVLSGDLALCERRRTLSLYAGSCYVGEQVYGKHRHRGTKVQAVMAVADDPTRGDVRRLADCLGFPSSDGNLPD